MRERSAPVRRGGRTGVAKCPREIGELLKRAVNDLVCRMCSADSAGKGAGDTGTLRALLLGGLFANSWIGSVASQFCLRLPLLDRRG